MNIFIRMRKTRIIYMKKKHKAMATFGVLRNIHDVRAHGKTAYTARFGEDFNGPIIPFGAGIKYKPSRQKDIGRMPTF